MEAYLAELSPEEAVVMEASCDSLYWAGHSLSLVARQGGVTVSVADRTRLFKGKESVSEILVDHLVSEVIVEALQIQVDLLRTNNESNERLGRRIVLASASLDDQIRVLITHPLHHPADRLRLSR